MRPPHHPAFGPWGKVFPEPAMTLAAVDRRVHHATTFEINVESYRRRAAIGRRQKRAGRPQGHATIYNLETASLHESKTKKDLVSDDQIEQPDSRRGHGFSILNYVFSQPDC